VELKLNNQVIMLLSDLGNENATFESYQHIALTNLNPQNKNELKRNLKYLMDRDNLLKNKIPLPLHEGRHMFGIVDETGTLEYGQVFIQYKNFDPRGGNTYSVAEGEFVSIV
jgi:hypothetical protein